MFQFNRANKQVVRTKEYEPKSLHKVYRLD